MNGKLLSNLEFGDYTLNHFTKSQTALSADIDNSLPRDLFDNAHLTLLTLTFINKITGIYHPIESGYRCNQLNKLVGGVETSLHQSALAIDFVCDESEKHISFLQCIKKYATAFVSSLYPHANFHIDVMFVNKSLSTIHLEIDFLYPIV